MKKIFLKMIQNNRNSFIILTLICGIISFIGSILPYLNGKFIDYLTIGVTYKIILEMSLLILVLGLINVALYYVKQILIAKIKMKSSFSIKMQIIEHLRNISILQFKKYDPSYLNQRTEQDINDIVAFITGNYPTVVFNAIQIVGLLFIIYRISKQIVLLMSVFIPIYYVIYLFIKKPLYDSSYAAKEAHSSYFNSLNDQFAFMEDIRINANYEYNNSYIEKYFTSYQQKYLTFVKISGKSVSCEGVISAIFQVVTFLYGGWQTLCGKMSVGELTVICTYFSMLLQLIKYYFELGGSYESVKTSIERINEIFSMKLENRGILMLDEIKSICGQITFGYDKNSILLRNVTINLEPGKIYCILGKNGCGKSTISKLLIGILHTDSLSINGININKLDMEKIRSRKILYISQALNYPNRTLKEIYQECKENIKLEDILYGISETNLSESTNICHLFEKNWNNNINNLSGGEKQIVSVLKCIVKDADIIILDEPTSSLDVKRKKVMFQIIEHLQAKNKILLIITHDTEIIQICDKTIKL